MSLYGCRSFSFRGEYYEDETGDPLKRRGNVVMYGYSIHATCISEDNINPLTPDATPIDESNHLVLDRVNLFQSHSQEAMGQVPK